MIKFPIHFIRKARPFKHLKLLVKKRFGWLGMPKIVPYIGFGSTQRVIITGAVIEDYGLSKPDEKQSLWKNILNMLKRYIADEIAGVQVKVEFKGLVKVVTTDLKGAFRCEFTDFESSGTWESVYFTLLEMIMEEQELETATGEVMIINYRPQFAVISDIDDTLLISHSTKALTKIGLMLFKNAYTRMPFPGVAEFYQALQKGNEAPGFNPFFYISSSEYNLYDLLYDFFTYRQIPLGPLLLRDMKADLMSLLKSGGGKHNHKLDKIKFVMNTYPDIDFILIGDSGQKDPEIYLEVINEFPGRIKTVYIRNVSRKKKTERIKMISETALGFKVKFLLVNDSAEAARHASEQGYILTSSLNRIEIGKMHDIEIVSPT